MAHRLLSVFALSVTAFASATLAHAAPGGAGVFDDKVTIAKATCTTDCDARCKAREVSACQSLPLRKHTPAAMCDAGAASYCTGLASFAKDDASRKALEGKAKAANEHLITACMANDALACAFAKSADTAVSNKLHTRACTLGIWEACATPADGHTLTADEDRHVANLAARACTEHKDATICDRASNRVKDSTLASALRDRGAHVGNALCRLGGAAAIEGCEWEAALTTTPAVAESQFAAAAGAAEAECKKGSVDACLSAGLFAGKDPGSFDTVLAGNAMRFIPIKRPGDVAKAKPFYIEACTLAWKADTSTDPINGPDACGPAKDAGVDIMMLAPPPPSGKRAPLTITPKKP